MNAISEKKVEQYFYPRFMGFLKQIFPDYVINDYYETADYPDRIKSKLSKATKTKKSNANGKPDAIFTVENELQTLMFVFEAKSTGIGKAANEALHYATYLEDLTHNLFRCSIDRDNLKIIHHQSNKELDARSAEQLFAMTDDNHLFTSFLEQVRTAEADVCSEEQKVELLTAIRTLNSSLREVGLSGQDRIDFASSLFLVKEIYDLVDEDFRRDYFEPILRSRTLKQTLASINNIATLDEIRTIFPDMSHLIVKDQIINTAKFEKVMDSAFKKKKTKAVSSGDNLNERIKTLITNKLLNLTKADFDFRGLIVEEFTHGNKGGGVSKEYGEFFTPRHIIKFIVDLADLQKGDKVFDPAFGTGGFLIEAFKRLVKINNNVIDEHLKKYSIYGAELQDWNVKAAKASLIALGDGHSNLINADFINGFSDFKIDNDPNTDGTLAPDVVLMNPPYSLGGHMTEWHFVKKCFDNLIECSAKDGKERRLIAVLPYEVCDQDKLMHQYSSYIDAYISLPYDVFQKYTSVRTQIIILKTTPRYTNDSGYIEPFFVAKLEADGFSLDGYRRPIQDNDIPIISERYAEYQQMRAQTVQTIKNIRYIDEGFKNCQLHQDDYERTKAELEAKIVDNYSGFRNDEKTSLLSYDQIIEDEHFDKAIWLINKGVPALVQEREDSAPICEFFHVVEEKGDFSDERYSELPYIEIGNVDTLSSFYTHSMKPKRTDKSSKVKGQIAGGIAAKKGDVIVSMVRTTRGAFAILREDALVTDAFAVLRPIGEIAGIELLSLLKQELREITRYIQYVGVGKLYPTITQQDFVAIKINKQDAEVACANYKSFLQELVDGQFM